MKKVNIYLLLLLISTALYASQGEIIYLEGDVEIKDKASEWRYAEIGESLEYGDTVITDEDGYLEIDREDSIIRIEGNTVFAFQEAEVNGEKVSGFTCVAGEVLFKVNKIRGTAPRINTLSANAGVRGTEFTLYAAQDGSSLIAVHEGVVEVSASGGSVVLAAEEGVEVLPGEAPGKKFKVLRGQISFAGWNDEKLKGFLESPEEAVYRLYNRMQFFAGEIKKLEEIYSIDRDQLDAERAVMMGLENEEGNMARKEYYERVVFPLEVSASYLQLNIRYYALSALSMRRYVLSGLYRLMKIKFVNDVNNQEYRDYLSAHNLVLSFFEENIAPFLVEADI